MLNIGEFSKLKVVKISGPWYYLSEIGKDGGRIIPLNYKNVPDGELSVGDEVDAFLYNDSNDRLAATLRQPLAVVGDIKYLKVVSNTKIGSFIYIGLDRDVFVPIREQNFKLEVDKRYLFYLYIDKTGRLAATTNIDRYLKNSLDYRVGDEVEGIVYGFQTNSSIMVAVENTYRGIILKNEYYMEIKPGDELHLRVKKQYEDGKMALTPRKPPKEERLDLENIILEYLKEHGGSMPYNDDTSPEIIKDYFHASKKYFKHALGGLMKQGLVEQGEYGTRLK